MKNQIQKDKKKRIYYLNCENTSKIFKSISKNSYVLKPIKWASDDLLLTKELSGFKTKTVSRCILTGRKTKIKKEFRFSRLTFLKLVRNGYIPGFLKTMLNTC